MTHNILLQLSQHPFWFILISTFISTFGPVYATSFDSRYLSPREALKLIAQVSSFSVCLAICFTLSLHWFNLSAWVTATGTEQALSNIMYLGAAFGIIAGGLFAWMKMDRYQWLDLADWAAKVILTGMYFAQLAFVLVATAGMILLAAMAGWYLLCTLLVLYWGSQKHLAKLHPLLRNYFNREQIANLKYSEKVQAVTKWWTNRLQSTGRFSEKQLQKFSQVLAHEIAIEYMELKYFPVIWHTPASRTWTKMTMSSELRKACKKAAIDPNFLAGLSTSQLHVTIQRTFVDAWTMPNERANIIHPLCLKPEDLRGCTHQGLIFEQHRHVDYPQGGWEPWDSPIHTVYEHPILGFVRNGIAY